MFFLTASIVLLFPSVSGTPERATSPVGDNESSEEEVHGNENNNNNKMNDDAGGKPAKDEAEETAAAAATTDDGEATKDEESSGDQQQQQQTADQQEVILIQDTSFTVKIQAPGVAEPFELQVSSMELVQEIHQVLMDREDTCHRTCFSLYIDGR